MKFYKLNKFISIFLSLLIVLFVTLSCYTCVYADNQSSGGHFYYGSNLDKNLLGTLYDGFDFSETIAKHKSFYFLDNAGNKHGVARVGTCWICLFGSRATFNGSQDELLNHYLSYYAYSGYKSINNAFGNLLSSKLSTATKGVSTMLEDVLSSNISTTANGITYNENDDSISFDSSCIDLLKDKIKESYYTSIGCFYIKSSGKPFNAVNYFKGKYEYEDELNSDLTASNNYDNAIVMDGYGVGVNYFWDDSDFSYLFFDSTSGNGASYYPKILAYSDDGLTKHNPTNVMKTFYSGLTYKNTDGDYYNERFIGNVNSSQILRLYCTSSICESNFLSPKYEYRGYYTSHHFYYYSKDNKPFTPFKSYNAYYNFINGDQNAYLGKTINETGQDLKLSINDMNENLGSKMDKLIDSINSGKGTMTHEELQDAIDKGIEDLNKNTEDIKDNTSDILEVLKEQNQILLDILGVTKHIADSVDDIDENANFSSLMSLLSTVFLGIQNAILYGQNTMNSDSSTDAQAVMYDEDEIAVYSSSGGTSLDYRGGIFGHFPFSVIYHLYDWLKVLQTEPKCPEFTYNYGFMLGRKDDTECQITFDLSQYESWRDVISSFMKLSFTLAVAVGTYKKFKGGDLS